MKYFILTVFSALTMLSCTSSTDVAIDNPSENPVIVKIDSLVVEVPAKEVVWVEMGKGEHNITLENNRTEKFNFQENTYMLNPTMSEYLMMEEYYGNEALRNAAPSVISNKKITFMGVDMEGNFEVVKKLINPVKWDYGPRESYPEMVEVEEGESYTLLTKLYDAPEVITLFNEYNESEQNKDFENTVKAGIPE